MLFLISKPTNNKLTESVIIHVVRHEKYILGKTGLQDVVILAIFADDERVFKVYYLSACGE